MALPLGPVAQPCLLSLLMLFPVSLALAQQVVSGKVSSAGSGLPGVVIRVQGGNTATNSDDQGNFSIRAEEGATLLFNLMGFRQQAYRVGRQATITIEMEQDVKVLDGVAVIGYGTQKGKTSPVP